MKRKRDRFFEHLIKQETLDAIFKSWAWVLLSAAIYRVSLTALDQDRHLFGTVSFAVFIVISSLIYLYVAKYIALPLESAMKGPFPGSAAPPSLCVIVKAPISALFSVSGFVYIVLVVGFFMFTNEFVKIIASSGANGC